MTPRIRKFVLFLAGWLALATLMLLFEWLFERSSVPKGPWGIIAFVLVAPPLYMLGEKFFGWLLSPEHGKVISPSSFSVARMLVALVVGVILLAFIAAAGALFR